MSHSVIGAIGLAVVLVVVIGGAVVLAFRRHNPERAAASVTVAAGVPFELQLPGSPGKLFFRFQINEHVGSRPVGKMRTIVDRTKDLLVSRRDRRRPRWHPGICRQDGGAKQD